MKFYISIKNRIAEVLSDGGTLPLLVCDNTDNSISFLFDTEWDAHETRTARFVYREDGGKGALVYVEVDFTGNTVAVPLLHNVREVFVGVIAGSLVTTSAARLSCVASVYGFSADPAGTAETETRTVALLFEDGDQIVTASAGKTMTSVVIEKPEALLPENIRAGVTIAGVMGTYTAIFEPTTLSAPTVTQMGYYVGITAIEDADLYDIHVVTPDGTDSTVMSVSFEEEKTYFDLESYLQVGANGVYVIAKNTALGMESPASETLTMDYTTPEYYLNAPVITLDGTTLTVTPQGGNTTVAFYKIYCEELEGTGTFEGGTLDLTTVASFEAGQTYTVYVTAYSMDTLVESPASNTVSYTAPLSDTEEDTASETLEAPLIAQTSTTVRIYAVGGAETYEIHVIPPSGTDTIVETVSVSGGKADFDLASYFEAGTNVVYVIARNVTENTKSPESNRINMEYTPASEEEATGNLSLWIQDASLSGVTIYYLKNGTVEELADGGYTGEFVASSDGTTFEGLSPTDSILLLISGGQHEFTEFLKDGCTFERIADENGIYCFARISNFDASVGDIEVTYTVARYASASA